MLAAGARIYYLAYSLYCFAGYLLISLIVWISTGYAYFVSQGYGPDDPARGNFDLGGVLLSGFTWPIFLLSGLVMSIIRALLFGVFIVLFSVVLTIGQIAFLIPWLEDVAGPFGEKLLEANSIVSRLFSRES